MVKNDDSRLDEEALLYNASLSKDKKEKAEIYKKAAEKFNSSRAYNNLAALSLQSGKTEEAENYLNKMSEQTPSYYNNMGVVELQKKNYDKASEYFTKAGTAESKENQGAIDILNGNYAEAAQELEGT